MRRPTARGDGCATCTARPRRPTAGTRAGSREQWDDQRAADAELLPVRPDRLDVRGRADGGQHAGVARGVRAASSTSSIFRHTDVVGPRSTGSRRSATTRSARTTRTAYRGADPGRALGQLRRARLDRERHRALGLADGPDRRRRQPVLQGVLPVDARAAPAHVGRRQVEPAVRHDPRRREHLHVDPQRDRRAPREPVARAPGGLPLREHEGLAVLPGRRGPRPACCTTCCAAPITTTVFDVWWETPCRTTCTCTSTARVPNGSTLYYDPILDMSRAAGRWAGSSRRSLPDAAAPRERRAKFYDFAVTLGRAARPGSATSRCCPIARHGLAFALATEFGDRVARDRLERSRRRAPSSPRGTALEFTWGFGLKEPHPRGQMNATIMVGEAGARGRGRASSTSQTSRSSISRPSPAWTFQTVGISEATYDESTRTLSVYDGRWPRCRDRTAHLVPRPEPPRSTQLPIT